MKNIFESIMAAIKNTAEPKTAEGDYVIVPEGYVLKDLEEFGTGPRVIKQTTNLTTARSFIKYVTDFATDYTALFADLKGQSFTAILDYHDPLNGPSWGKHKAAYSCPVDSRWQIWTQRDGDTMSQTAFAQFIEDNLIDIVEPNGSDMLTISKELQAKKDIDFKSHQNLANGDVQFTYNEQTSGSAGTMEIPTEFKLGIPVYEGGDKYEVTARLRYRISSGNLVMWYDLLRPERMVEDAFKEIQEEIQTALAEKVTFFEGKAS